MRLKRRRMTWKLRRTLILTLKDLVSFAKLGSRRGMTLWEATHICTIELTHFWRGIWIYLHKRGIICMASQPSLLQCTIVAQLFEVLVFTQKLPVSSTSF